jgi:hypothetical protein
MRLPVQIIRQSVFTKGADPELPSVRCAVFGCSCTLGEPVWSQQLRPCQGQVTLSTIYERVTMLGMACVFRSHCITEQAHCMNGQTQLLMVSSSTMLFNCTCWRRLCPQALRLVHMNGISHLGRSALRVMKTKLEDS